LHRQIPTLALPSKAARNTTHNQTICQLATVAELAEFVVRARAGGRKAEDMYQDGRDSGPMPQQLMDLPLRRDRYLIAWVDFVRMATFAGAPAAPQKIS
jgi:hypothetical protein